MTAPQLGPRPYGGCGCSVPFFGCSGCLILILAVLAVAGLFLFA